MLRAILVALLLCLLLPVQVDARRYHYPDRHDVRGYVPWSQPTHYWGETRIVRKHKKRAKRYGKRRKALMVARLSPPVAQTPAARISSAFEALKTPLVGAKGKNYTSHLLCDDDRSTAPGTIRLKTKSGKCYAVAEDAAKAFSGFVAWLESVGYRIDAIGGYAFRRIAGSRSWSNHARAAALDINQCGRNCVTRELPSDVTTKAREFGLRHGAIWNNPDTGHFELIDAKQYALLGDVKTVAKSAKKKTGKVRYAKRYKRYHRYAGA